METTSLLDGEDQPVTNEAHDGYILGADFGSTCLVVKIYMGHCVVASSSVKVPYLILPDGGIEIDPIQIFDIFIETAKNLLLENKIPPFKLKCSGFSFQRGTFLIWDKKTGTPRCNLISWEDNRCASVVKETNRSYLMRALNLLGSIGYFLYKSKTLLLMKVLRFHVRHASMKLKWLLKNDPPLFAAVNQGEVLFGTMDTWIIWKLTNGTMHITDFSCAAGTGLFDPYECEWSSFVTHLLGIKLDMFPKVVDTSGFITDIDENVFGSSVPINAVVADTQAGLFGLNCFDVGQSCCLMGTGFFLTFNSGSYAHASIAGLYPQIGWKIGEELVYCCEGNISGIASSIEWIRGIGMYEDVSLTSDMAKSVDDTGGLYFVPGFAGLSAPHNDPSACCGLIGIKRNTSKAQIVRAILEGIAFRYLELYQVALDETKLPFHSTIRVSGGLSRNDFLLELISSITNCDVERVDDSDITLTGAVYLAGLGSGIWKDKQEIKRIEVPVRVFTPDPLMCKKYTDIYKKWQNAVKRCLHWYS